MNFIFDIGNVLLDFNPKEFLSDIICDTEIEQKIYQTIFKSEEWVNLDRGTITEDEAQQIFISKIPKLESYAIKTMKSIPEMLTPKYDTIDYLQRIKDAGHKLYFLSNFHKWLSIYVQNKYSFFEHFDGGVFSCDVHMIKPSLEIYQYLLNKYNLAANECIFFDDTKENADAATKLGIRSVLFANANQIDSVIRSL